MDQPACAEQPSARSIATNDALALLKAHLSGQAPADAAVSAALRTIADRLGYGLIHYDNEDEDDPVSLRVDEHELDEARARAMRGEVADAVIHLGRALPSEFAVIADRIGDHLRSAS